MIRICNEVLLEKGESKSRLGVISRSGVQEGIIALQLRLGDGSSFGWKALRKIQLPWRKSAGEREILWGMGLLNWGRENLGQEGRDEYLEPVQCSVHGDGWHVPPIAPCFAKICWL